MFGFHRRPTGQVEVNAPTVPVIGSKRIREIVEESYEIALSANATPAEVELATRELTVYAQQIGYPEAHIEDAIIDGSRVLSFKGAYAAHGTNYNPQVYSNITWVEDLL